jgi:alkylation response protein AidB-like acyl-CoA dehydrogenase
VAFMGPTTELVAADDVLVAAAEFDRLLTDLSPTPLEEFSDTVWRTVEEGGWLQVSIGEEGAATTLVDLCEFAEVWGRHLVPGPFVTTVLAVKRAGAPGQSELSATATGISYSLGTVDGRALIPFGDLAGIVCPESIGPSGMNGQLAYRELGTDTFAPSLPLVIADVGTQCDADLERETFVMRAAEAVGAASHCLRRAVDYTMVRQAYGQELAKFQAVRHRLADTHRDIEVCRGLMASAVVSEEDAAASCRLAVKLARRVIEAAVQVHGGIGFTWDIPLHRYLRHVMVIEKILA